MLATTPVVPEPVKGSRTKSCSRVERVCTSQPAFPGKQRNGLRETCQAVFPRRCAISPFGLKARSHLPSCKLLFPAYFQLQVFRPLSRSDFATSHFRFLGESYVRFSDGVSVIVVSRGFAANMNGYSWSVVGRSVTDEGIALGLYQMISLRKIHLSSCNASATRHGIPSSDFRDKYSPD